MKKIEISHRTIIFTVFFLILLWFLYYIRDIILIFFLALLIMAILNPTVTKFSRWKIPRAVSVIVVYLMVIALFVLAVVGVIPPLVEQSANFANNLPGNITHLRFSSILGDQFVREILSLFSKVPSQIIKVGFSVFSNAVAIVMMLILAFYLLMARNRLDDQLVVIVGDKRKEKVQKLIDRLELKLGSWARGQLVLMLLIGLMSFLGLTILGIPYALPLALLAGILEIIPNIGPVVAAIPAVVIGFSLSPVIGFAAIALYFLIQQAENYFLVPKIMQKSIGVSPIVTLLVIAIGLKVAGVIGVLISVPVFITAQVLLSEFVFSRKN